MAQRSVLVVDDETVMGELIAELLAAEGYMVDVASSGATALEKLYVVSFDLVLCDVRMPGMDGPTLYREAQRIDRRLRQRFVFLTGGTLQTETAEFLAGSGAPCLAKPFQIEELRQVAAKKLGGH